MGPPPNKSSHHQSPEPSPPTANVLQRSNSYNPFEHRQVEKPTGDIRSLANLLKASLGSGILAIPLAFSNSGWFVGIIGTFFVAFVCGYCVHIFVLVSRECCKLDRVPQMGYAETCRSCFSHGPKWCQQYAKAAYIFADSALFATCMGVCCIFTVLIADSIKQPLDEYVFKTNHPVSFYVLMLIIPLCLMVQIKHLKWLAPFSLAANILLFATFVTCLYYIFKDTISIHDKRMFGDISRFPAFLSTVIFAMEGIGVVMPVENTMKKPEHFLGCPSILVVAMSFIMVMYMTLGLFGYWRFGDVLRGSITLNLPIDDTPAVFAKWCIAISIFFSYPLHFYVLVDTVFRAVKPYVKEKHKTVIFIGIRICCVLLCSGVGIVIPMLEQIINLVGALFYSTLGLIIPGIVDIVFYHNDQGKYRWILWKDIGLISFGLAALISGCAITIQDIITLSSKESGSNKVI